MVIESVIHVHSLFCQVDVKLRIKLFREQRFQQNFSEAAHSKDRRLCHNSTRSSAKHRILRAWYRNFFVPSFICFQFTCLSNMLYRILTGLDNIAKIVASGFKVPASYEYLLHFRNERFSFICAIVQISQPLWSFGRHRAEELFPRRFR